MIDQSTKDRNFGYEEIGSPGTKSSMSTTVVGGKQFPPQQLIMLYTSNDWEAFVEEWAHHQKTKYKKVVRLSGSGDMGVDVAGFTDNQEFQGVWDNYQCKHYAAALTPGTALPEVAKIIWHSFNGRYVPPRKFYFVAPKGCGMSLGKLLLKSDDLKSRLQEKWSDWCAGKITAKEIILLEGEFLEYVNSFDFSIFTFKTALEIIEEHRQTPYFSTRFGESLPDRPDSETPPEIPVPTESRYIEQLFEAYSDHENSEIGDINALQLCPQLVKHHNRQREFFYHAESLRNFARDSVPEGTFDDLKDEVYAGVVDIECNTHVDGLTRMNAVTQAASSLQITSNDLISVVKIQDRKGICHQLANDDRLCWRPK